MSGSRKSDKEDKKKGKEIKKEKEKKTSKASTEQPRSSALDAFLSKPSSPQSKDQPKASGGLDAFLKAASESTASSQLKRPPANVDATFKFKESSNPYDYANVRNSIGANPGAAYSIMKMGEHLQFHSRKESADPKPNGDDPRNRMRMFQAKTLETDSVGWKLHISVAPTDIDKAWSLIHPILTSHQTSGFKMIHPDVLAEAFKQNKLDKIGNKQFTIYQSKNAGFDDRKWGEVIKEIDETLKTNNIKAAKSPDVDRKIEGSDYFSYRNDTHPTKRATGIDAIEAKAYIAQAKDKNLEVHNLSKAPDPFENVRPFAKKGPGL